MCFEGEQAKILLLHERVIMIYSSWDIPFYWHDILTTCVPMLFIAGFSVKRAAVINISSVAGSISRNIGNYKCWCYRESKVSFFQLKRKKKKKKGISEQKSCEVGKTIVLNYNQEYLQDVYPLSCKDLYDTIIKRLQRLRCH